MKLPSNLLIAEPADRPLTPGQRKFNQLVRKIEQARAELLAWQEQVPLFAQTHAQRARPLLGELAACRREVVVRLDALLDRAGWTKTERGAMRSLLCDVAGALIEDEQTDDAHVVQLKALYDKHADTDFDTENRQAMAAMKGLFETMSGVDLGDEDFESEEALLARAHERLGEQAQAREQAQPQRVARKSAAQRRRETDEQAASQSMREIYRKLVSALHPDRAADEADRRDRTALMQRLNQAHDAKDLLALFALQLEIEQVDAAHLAHATAERARHFNRVLAAQLAELQAEVQVRQTAFCMDFGIDPYRRLTPHKLGALLDREVKDLCAALAEARRDLGCLDDPASTRRWLTRMRRQQRAFESDELF
jgi:hypothetical protein